MLIRANKIENKIDDSLLIPQLEGFENIELKEGWEWIELNSDWFANFEFEKMNHEKALAEIELELKASTRNLADSQMIDFFIKKVEKQEEIIELLIIEGLKNV